MGPFTDPAHPGKPNLYSTEEHRHLVPATLLPAFPAGTFMAWAYQGLKVTAPDWSVGPFMPRPTNTIFRSRLAQPWRTCFGSTLR
jgi:hypothetical protein